MPLEIQINGLDKILKDHGVTPDGDVQKQLTRIINLRIGAYMPHLTGVLENDSKRIADPTSIIVDSVYAQYQYYGMKMVNAATGKGPANIPNVGYRFPKDSQLKRTNIPLNYTKTYNAKAGPYWDKRMMAAEGDQIGEEISDYANNHRSR